MTLVAERTVFVKLAGAEQSRPTGVYCQIKKRSLECTTDGWPRLQLLGTSDF